MIRLYKCINRNFFKIKMAMAVAEAVTKFLINNVHKNINQNQSQTLIHYIFLFFRHIVSLSPERMLFLLLN